MKRWHDETNHYRRQQAKDRTTGTCDWCEKGACWHCKKKQLGRFRKRHSMDCGKVQCKVCHSDKFPKRELTEQEVLARLSHKEQMKEFKE